MAPFVWAVLGFFFQIFSSDGKKGGGTGWRVFMSAGWLVCCVNQKSVAVIGQNLAERGPGLSEK